MEARIQAAIRAAAVRDRDVERIGPFVATFNRSSDNPYLNYAIPDEGADPSPDDVRALAAAFERRGRRPRLEYLESLAPAVEQALAAAGFRPELRTPLMTCSSLAAVRVAVPDGFDVSVPRSDDDFVGAAGVQWEAYEEEGPVPEHAVASLRRTQERGGLVALARELASGEPAGAGVVTAPEEGASELTSVAVRERFRRRGVAQGLTGRLAHDALAGGVELLFLMAHGEAEARIYARAGFELRGAVLHISRRD